MNATLYGLNKKSIFTAVRFSCLFLVYSILICRAGILFGLVSSVAGSNSGKKSKVRSEIIRYVGAFTLQWGI